MRVRAALGRFGEQAAAAWLERAGWVILCRNWRCPSGEIDIVARDGSTIVFVEVKTRSSVAFGNPAEAVDAGKARRIRAVAAQWLAQRDAATFTEVRFDVVSVLRGADGLSITRVEAAF
jgi:putative endonuclease